jgi:hypothetical protein
VTGNLWLCRAVKVISGQHANKRGFVTAIDNETLTIREWSRMSTFTASTSEVKTID